MYPNADIAVGGNTANNYKRVEKIFKKIRSIRCAQNEGAIDIHHDLNTKDIKFEKNIQINENHPEAKLYSINNINGVYIIPSCISRTTQLELVYNSLNSWVQPPNISNIHSTINSTVEDEQDRLEQINNATREVSNVWKTEGCSHSNKRDATEAYKAFSLSHTDISDCARLPKDCILNKLRWVTLGHQYDWTARRYPLPSELEEAHKAMPMDSEINKGTQNIPKFPPELGKLTSRICELCGVDMVAEAGIINYYPDKAMMGGHKDDAEQNKTTHLVSFSIGAPCLFLLGGDDVTTTPIPILLYSGDVLLFGGESRLRLHGVPKVFILDADNLPSSECMYTDGLPYYFRPYSEYMYSAKLNKKYAYNNDKSESTTPDAIYEQEAGEEIDHDTHTTTNCDSKHISNEEELCLIKYLTSHRINISIRQVYNY